MQQQAQLAHWQGWCQQLAAAAPPIALNAAALLAARQVCVCGLPAKVLEVRWSLVNHNLKVFRGGKLVLTSLYMVKGFGLAGCCQPLGQLLPPAADVPQHRLPGLHQQLLTTYFICCCCCAGVPAEGPGYFLWRAHGC